MAASMWEVTRLVLGAPGDAAGIAQAHGFTIAQVTDLLPLFLDNVTTGYGEAAELPPGLPDGPDADAAARWLEGWAQQVGDGTVDVVSYGGFGAPDLHGDPFETGGPDLPDPSDSDLPDAGPDDVVTFGLGGADGGGSPDGAPDGTHPAPDEVTDHDATSDVDLDDPFDLGDDPDVDLQPGLDGDPSGDHHDPGSHPHGTAGDDASFH
ncbi:hypothetical protein [Pseudonocardia sp.]|uniref:hypothetical protein n=1 Tax=Pseudonocardia sp. TaxID=60912 RepID=UPI003D0C350F